MFMGVLVGGKRYSQRDYAAALLITGGIVAFTLKQHESGQASAPTGTNQLLGLALVAINLALDGFTNARQEAICKATRCQKYHMMYWVNVHSALLLGAWLVFGMAYWGEESELRRAVVFTSVSPEVILHVAVFALCGAVGQIFIFSAIQEFGAVVCTTICLTRKFFSILLSIVLYAHPVQRLQWAGIGLVFSGLGLQVWNKMQTPVGGTAQMRSQNTPKHKKNL